MKSLRDRITLIPPLAWLTVFLFLPVAVIVLVSFWTPTFSGFEPTFTFSNYRLFFTTPTYVQMVWVTLFNAIVTTVVSLLIAYPVAYFLTFVVTDLRAKIALFILALTPFWTSYLIRIIAWIPMLGRNGLLNMALMKLGIISEPLEFLLFSNVAVIIAMVQLYSLFMVAPIFYSLSGIDVSVVEAARDLGASSTQIFREIIWPLSLPGVMIGTVFVFVLSMGEFSTVRLIGGGNASSMGLAIQNFVNYIQFPPAAAVASVLVVILMISVWIFFKLGNVREDL